MEVTDHSAWRLYAAFAALALLLGPARAYIAPAAVGALAGHELAAQAITSIAASALLLAVGRRRSAAAPFGKVESDLVPVSAAVSCHARAHSPRALSARPRTQVGRCRDPQPRLAALAGAAGRPAARPCRTSPRRRGCSHRRCQHDPPVGRNRRIQRRPEGPSRLRLRSEPRAPDGVLLDVRGPSTRQGSRGELCRKTAAPSRRLGCMLLSRPRAASLREIDWPAALAWLALSAALTAAAMFLWFWLLQHMQLSGFVLHPLAIWTASLLGGMAVFGVANWRNDTAAARRPGRVVVRSARTCFGRGARSTGTRVGSSPS